MELTKQELRTMLEEIREEQKKKFDKEFNWGVVIFTLFICICMLVYFLCGYYYAFLKITYLS